MAELITKNYNFQEIVKSNITGAANLLKRKAEEIASDCDDEKVREIYITLRINSCEEPILDVTKSYYSIP